MGGNYTGVGLQCSLTVCLCVLYSDPLSILVKSGCTQFFDSGAIELSESSDGDSANSSDYESSDDLDPSPATVKDQQERLRRLNLDSNDMPGDTSGPMVRFLPLACCYIKIAPQYLMLCIGPLCQANKEILRLGGVQELVMQLKIGTLLTWMVVNKLLLLLYEACNACSPLCEQWYEIRPTLRISNF